MNQLQNPKNQNHRPHSEGGPATLSEGTYTAETGKVDKHLWNVIVEHFDDATLMQTWSYGAIRWGQENLSHVVLKNDGELVAAAQAAIMKLPLLDAGLAYIKWGPLWQSRGRERNLEAFRQALRVLREIYVVRRGFLLRIYPNGIEDGSGAMRSILEEEGFQRDSSVGTHRTAIIDLSYGLEELRNSFRPNWRRNLTLGERNGLEVVDGVGDALFAVFIRLYEEMRARKKGAEIADISYFPDIQRDLPDAFKMRVMICKHQGQPIAGIAVPMLGDTALNMLAATGDRGLDLRGSYLLHWQMLIWLKLHGFRWYDLYGINPTTHPGTYQFKKGFAGRLGRDVEYLGQYHSCRRTMSSLVVKVGMHLRNKYLGIRIRT